MKFTRKCIIINTSNNSIVAYFNEYEDAKEFIGDLKKRHPYNYYQIYMKPEDE